MMRGKTITDKFWWYFQCFVVNCWPCHVNSYTANYTQYQQNAYVHVNTSPPISIRGEKKKRIPIKSMKYNGNRLAGCHTIYCTFSGHKVMRALLFSFCFFEKRNLIGKGMKDVTKFNVFSYHFLFHYWISIVSISADLKQHNLTRVSANTHTNIISAQLIGESIENVCNTPFQKLNFRMTKVIGVNKQEIHT